ncbi:SHOCT domain-containing protein [Natrialba sp. INN-245]|uniref:SHOCT domain-containing protein n=1 Tax=Natrialba sp. INN-245 TaxID=2690967 RepID=UPI0013101A04|nr:SHOCT domain-containing protein [Natrialba sp. INN-245]MWV39050.1 SHOCT domain-containing protein [Natrialba sp. INN-245]
MSADTDLLRTLLLVVALVILVPFLLMFLVWPMMGMWGGGHMWDNGGASGVGSTLSWLVIWLPMFLLVLGGAYLLYRAIDRTESDDRDAALEELRLAYARGDLSDEEFEQRRERLQRDK